MVPRVIAEVCVHVLYNEALFLELVYGKDAAVRSSQGSPWCTPGTQSLQLLIGPHRYYHLPYGWQPLLSLFQTGPLSFPARSTGALPNAGEGAANPLSTAEVF